MAGQIPTKEQTVLGPKKTTPAKTPGKAVAKTPKPEEKSDFTPTQAKAHTEKIKKGASATWEQIEKAFKGRIWLALGHKSWDDYCDNEFHGVPLALPREKKKQAIESLAAAGVSSRAIAKATGVSQSTANRAASVITDPAPESNDSPVIDAEVVEDGLSEFAPEGRTVQGQDGKTYPVTPREPKEEAPINVVSEARNIVKDLDAVRIRLDSLFSRDDYEENKVDVQGTLETSVSDFIDTLVEEFADLVSERAPQGEPEPAV